MDLTKFALVVMKNVREFVQPALDAIDGRIDALKREVSELRAAKPLDLDAVVASAVANIPKPVDGKDADPEAIMAAARAAVAELPLPKDGESVTPDQVLPELRSVLQEAIAALPVPADGKSLTVEDVLPLLESMQAKWELDFERRAQDVLQRAIDRMPKPKDGEDGRDGFGFDDMSLEQIDERHAVLRFTRGAVVKEFPIELAGFVDRDVWREGEFEKGDGCTWDGNYWLARRATTQKPGEGDDWRLAVRKGRKGKDGADLRPKAPVGPPKLTGRV